MKLIDQFKYGNKAIWSRKFRSFLTMLGVIIGIAAIVSINSLSAGFELQMSEQFENDLSTNVVTVLKTEKIKGGQITTEIEDFDYYFSDAIALEQMQYIDVALFTITQKVNIEYQGENLSITVVGVDFNKYYNVYSSQFEAEYGDIPFDPEEASFVIGYNIYKPVDDVFVNVGDYLNISWSVKNGTTIDYFNFQAPVSAVLPEVGVSIQGGPSDTTIYLPLNKALELFDYSGLGIASNLYIKLTEYSEEALDTVTTELRDFYGVDTINLVSSNSIIETMQTSMDSIFSFLSSLAAVSLLIAGIGIMNTMYISVAERTREIGILKALGIKDRSIMKIFLSETIIIGLIGGIIGLIGGYISAWAFGSSMLSTSSIRIGGGRNSSTATTTATTAIIPIITPSLAFQAIIFGVILSVVFGLYPAWKASKKQPVEALRHE